METEKCWEANYHYFYKITNLVNKKYYYGVHSTNDLEDGYLGSGRLIKKAIKKYGSKNFKKEILGFFPDRKSLLQEEAKVVTKELLDDPNCYNLDLGGRGSFYPYMSSETNEEKKLRISKGVQTKKENGIYEKISLENIGYNNPEFKKLTKPKYEKNKNEILFFIKNTTLYDMGIEKLFNINCHDRHCIKYLRDTYLEKDKYEDSEIFYDGFTRPKTFYLPNKSHLIPAAFYTKSILKRIPTITEIIKYLQDNTCTISDVFNKKKYHFNQNDIKFFKYLGILTNEKTVNIINEKHSGGQRKTWIVNFNSKYLLIDGGLNLYGINEHGKLIQKSKFRLQDYEALAAL